MCTYRWEMWLQFLQDDLRLHRPYNAGAWHEQVTKFTLFWTHDRKAFASEPTGDALGLSQALYDKYANAIEQSSAQSAA